MLGRFDSIGCAPKRARHSLLLTLAPLASYGILGIEIKAIQSSPKRGGDIGALSGDGSSYKKETKAAKALYGALTHWLWDLLNVPPIYYSQSKANKWRYSVISQRTRNWARGNCCVWVYLSSIPYRKLDPPHPKVDAPYIGYLYMGNRYAVCCGFRNGYQNDTCLEEIGLYVQNIIIILGSVVNMIEGTYKIFI